MADTYPPVPLTLASRVDQVFPTLTPEQIARIAAHGHVRPVQPGDVLVEAGEKSPCAWCMASQAFRSAPLSSWK